ncbi:helix-turn-helix domain-containing protein [Mycobacterium deserti]|uniref:AraC family transcriptional regulator n=1 Tax=Mycobacterium deserti TaxID=2978347 RepID=A0ABT2MC75_9MYCO|nr:AraC family transcriptional regulator [Mycobacterium deserti]MCT7659870.1 AraC family transcriptional regulator [Mycobacterium deserti]
MRYRRHRPSPPLRDAVEFVWCMDEGPTHSRERVLPGGAAELVINLRDDEIKISDSGRPGQDRRFSGAVICGPYTRPFDIDPSAHTTMLGVHFKPGGAQAFLPMALSELADSHVDLEHVWGRRAQTLRSQVCEADTAEERLALMQSALVSRLRSAHELRATVVDAVRALSVDDSPPPIRDVVTRSDLCHRQLIDVFTATVGTTPKVFSRIRRFRRALSRIESGNVPAWAELAVASGYSDQSHMIREFRTLSGLTPVEHVLRRALATKDDHVAVTE